MTITYSYPPWIVALILCAMIVAIVADWCSKRRK